MAGDTVIIHRRDITTKNVTLEVQTQNSDCHNGLCHLAQGEIKDSVAFLTPGQVKTLIGFKGKEGFEASVDRILGVLGNFSGQVEASIFNA